MRYDIFFVRRDPGQSFADALDANEDSYDGDPGPLSPAEREQWDRILPRARRVLDQIEEESTGASSRELVDQATGIELTMIAGEVTITVGSVRHDLDAVELMEQVYALARIVEDETGLEGYDPQLQEPVSTPRELRGSGGSRTAADRRHGDDDGDAAGRAAPAPSQRVDRVAAGDSALTPGRRWWEIWKP